MTLLLTTFLWTRLATFLVPGEIGITRPNVLFAVCRFIGNSVASDRVPTNPLVCFATPPFARFAVLNLWDGQSEHDFSVQDPTSHITNTGRIIEDMEIKMRGLLQEVSRLFFFSFARSNHHHSTTRHMVSVPISRFMFRSAPANISHHMLSIANHDARSVLSEMMKKASGGRNCPKVARERIFTSPPPLSPIRF